MKPTDVLAQLLKTAALAGETHFGPVPAKPNELQSILQKGADMDRQKGFKGITYGAPAAPKAPANPFTGK